MAQGKIDSTVRPYRVLSLDGGGMRGLYTASLLKSLSDRFSNPNSQPVSRDIGKGFDLIVGTSTGGILATGLVAGVPIDRIIEIYTKEGRNIFKKKNCEDKKGTWPRCRFPPRKKRERFGRWYRRT